MRSGLSNTVARVVTRLSASKSFWFFVGLFSVAMLGCVMMWGQPWQPDVWMLFAGIFAVYALWRFWIAWRKGMPAHTLFAGVAPRFLLTLVVAGLVGATGIRQVFPYMDYLRAPVKFLHFTEVVTALLAGFGLEALLAIRTPARLRRGFLLVWNERYSPDLVARIDGNVVPVHQADGLWCAIPVPSGRHQITVRMRYQPLWNLIAAGTSLLVVLAGLAGARAKAHRNGMG